MYGVCKNLMGGGGDTERESVIEEQPYRLSIG